MTTPDTGPTTRPATLNSTASVQLGARPEHVWRADDGEVCGSLDLGGSNWIVFHDAAQARHMAKLATELAELMEAYPPEGPPDGA